MKSFIFITLFLTPICCFSQANPEFIDSIKVGDVERVKFFIDEGHDIYQKDERGLSALDYAILKENQNFLALFLQYSFELESKEASDLAADFLALSNGYREKVRPLVWATEHNKILLLNYLLSSFDINVNGTFHTSRHSFLDQGGYTALQIALSERNNEAVKILLNTPNIDINSVVNQTTPLEHAIVSGNLDTFSLLVNDEKFEIDRACNFTGAFRSLGIVGNITMFNLLIEKIDVSRLSTLLSLSLLFAAERGNNDLANELLKINDINPNISGMICRKDFGDPAIIRAVASGHLEVVKLLVNHSGTALNVQSRFNRKTPLMIATDQENSDIIELLLNSGKIDRS